MESSYQSGAARGSESPLRYPRGIDRSFMTREQAAKLGIHPGMPGPNGIIPIVKLSTLRIQPVDA